MNNSKTLYKENIFKLNEFIKKYSQKENIKSDIQENYLEILEKHRNLNNNNDIDNILFINKLNNLIKTTKSEFLFKNTLFYIIENNFLRYPLINKGETTEAILNNNKHKHLFFELFFIDKFNKIKTLKQSMNNQKPDTIFSRLKFSQLFDIMERLEEFENIETLYQFVSYYDYYKKQKKTDIEYKKFEISKIILKKMFKNCLEKKLINNNSETNQKLKKITNILYESEIKKVKIVGISEDFELFNQDSKNSNLLLKTIYQEKFCHPILILANSIDNNINDNLRQNIFNDYSKYITKKKNGNLKAISHLIISLLKEKYLNIENHKKFSLLNLSIKKNNPIATKQLIDMDVNFPQIDFITSNTFNNLLLNINTAEDLENKIQCYNILKKQGFPYNKKTFKLLFEEEINIEKNKEITNKMIQHIKKDFGIENWNNIISDLENKISSENNNKKIIENYKKTFLKEAEILYEHSKITRNIQNKSQTKRRSIL